jgi:deferrochelatase/peroxidase EfeB
VVTDAAGVSSPFLPGEPEVDLREVQADVYPGFGAPAGRYIGYAITDAPAARHWLRALAAEVTTASWLLEPGRRRAATGAELLGVSLSAEALALLGRPVAFADPSMAGGFTRDRAIALGDPAIPPSRWRVGAPARPVHVLVHIGGTDEAVRRRRHPVPDTAAGVRVTWSQRCTALEGDREHFGFPDGLSQPQLLGRRADQVAGAVFPRPWTSVPPGTGALRLDAGTPFLWPGELLFGFPRQGDRPREPGELALAAGGSATSRANRWTRHGSLVVVRRLRQRVGGFWRWCEETAAALQPAWPGITREEVAELVMGRRLDGSPLRPPGVPAPDRANDFDFGADVLGRTCPLAAHVRKVNPRAGPFDVNPLRRRFWRRGLPFGRPVAGDPAHDPDRVDRGLLFVACATSIHDRFEFVQQRWASNPDRPGGDGSGHDLVIGQPVAAGRPALRRLALPTPSGTVVVETTEPFVVPSGGAYLFAPSVSALAAL